MQTIKNAKVWKYKSNIDTDLIIAARYLNQSDPKHLAKYAMADLDENFAKEVQEGDVIVAGENFGCGSSREHAPIALKACGIKAVITPYFARIFYRNAFNMGLAIFEIEKNDIDKISQDDRLDIDIQNGVIKNTTTNEEYAFKPIPPFMQELLSSGGLMNMAKKELQH